MTLPIDDHDVLGGLMRDSLDHCVKCTICETFCPVSNVTPLFPGPKYAGPQAERFRVPGEESPDASLDYCSGCGICTQVCPQGVHIAEINAQARARLKERTGVPLRDRLIARPDVTGMLGRPVAGLANRVLANPLARYLGERMLGLDRRAPVPSFARQTFLGWARRRPAPAVALGRRRVAYFPGCGTNWYEPEVGRATVELLEHFGVQVTVPRGQRCCGLPLQSNGMFRPARAYTRRLAGRLAPAARAGYDIVGGATSCTLMLKREAREILGLEHDPDVRLVSDHVYDISEYLMMMAGELEGGFRPLPMRVVYHAPCQQQGHAIGKPALDLLAMVPELEVVESGATCCGIAGTYGLKQDKHQIALDVGAGLFAQIERERPDLVVCDSDTCRWHITQATGVPCAGPAELLHRAAGLD